MPIFGISFFLIVAMFAFSGNLQRFSI
jgi:hypothetical protein